MSVSGGFIKPPIQSAPRYAASRESTPLLEWGLFHTQQRAIDSARAREPNVEYGVVAVFIGIERRRNPR